MKRYEANGRRQEAGRQCNATNPTEDGAPGGHRPGRPVKPPPYEEDEKGLRTEQHGILPSRPGEPAPSPGSATSARPTDGGIGAGGQRHLAGRERAGRGMGKGDGLTAPQGP